MTTAHHCTDNGFAFAARRDQQLSFRRHRSRRPGSERPERSPFTRRSSPPSEYSGEGIAISARSLLSSFGMQDIRRQRARDEALAREVPLALIKESDRLRLRELPYQGIEELAEKIRLHGQTSPVFIRGIPEGFELIAGYRRC